MLDPPAGWYGVDPIHVRRGMQAAAWAEALGLLPDFRPRRPRPAAAAAPPGGPGGPVFRVRPAAGDAATDVGGRRGAAVAVLIERVQHPVSPKRKRGG